MYTNIQQQLPKYLHKRKQRETEKARSRTADQELAAFQISVSFLSRSELMPYQHS